ncbi:hypothetical protein J3458_000766 [Metarhizium acridum]|uniref:uncharacterized protein n=1 Tax=Metarhizium acridum TaxID=92637 RepID=UPI001C6D2788|nr:hypothetical protein J3458_000766 [Metarhizium acridum]
MTIRDVNLANISPDTVHSQNPDHNFSLTHRSLKSVPVHFKSLIFNIRCRVTISSLVIQSECVSLYLSTSDPPPQNLLVCVEKYQKPASAVFGNGLFVLLTAFPVPEGEIQDYVILFLSEQADKLPFYAL